MKKALIIAYAKKNLGDDLFIHVLVNRYKKTKFYLSSKTFYDKSCFKASNLKFVNRNVINFLNNLASKNKRHFLNTNNILSGFCDATVLIGGSMFIQNADMDTVKTQVGERFSHLKNKYYILGSNFGPYKDDEYYNLHYNVFKNAEDVCFREEYSYNLFKDLKNVKYASDIVFSMDTKNINKEKKKEVVISVIDLSFRKEFANLTKSYERKIKEMVEYYVALGYSVTLMSFCKFEGDEKAISNITGLLDSDINSKVNVYNYDGDIDEALGVIARSEIVVATRFHAMILGLIFNCTVIPVIYSNKTLNVMKDINFTGDYVKIEDIDKLDISSLNLDYKLDISKQVLDAKRHFESLDMFLK